MPNFHWNLTLNVQESCLKMHYYAFWCPVFQENRETVCKILYCQSKYEYFPQTFIMCLHKVTKYVFLLLLLNYALSHVLRED